MSKYSDDPIDMSMPSLSLEDGELEMDAPMHFGPYAGDNGESDLSDLGDLASLPEVVGGAMSQTDFGAHPWGPGSGIGFRPMSLARTDQAPLGNTDDDGLSQERAMLETAGEIAASSSAPGRRPTPQEMAHPDVDATTLYDRSSYEPHSSDGWMEPVTSGTGIFDMPEGATFRPDQGIFAHHYALPTYLAEEPETEPYASSAIDLNTGLPRVMQPSAAGVQLRGSGTQAYSPFAPPAYGQSAQVRTQPGVAMPRSGLGSTAASAGTRRIEVFGHKSAALMLQAVTQRCRSAGERGQFICNALEYLGPQRSELAMQAVERLTKLGYPSEHVTRKVLATMIMHETWSDLRRTGGRGGNPLPSVTNLGRALGSVDMLFAAKEFMDPLTSVMGQVEAEVAQYEGSTAAQEAAALLTPPAPSSGVPKAALAIGGIAAGFLGWKFFSDSKKTKS